MTVARANKDNLLENGLRNSLNILFLQSGINLLMRQIIPFFHYKCRLIFIAIDNFS